MFSFHNTGYTGRLGWLKGLRCVRVSRHCGKLIGDFISKRSSFVSFGCFRIQNPSLTVMRKPPPLVSLRRLRSDKEEYLQKHYLFVFESKTFIVNRSVLRTKNSFSSLSIFVKFIFIW